MKDFQYVAPGRVEEAVALRAEHGDRSRLLAGGTDLIVQLREGQVEADVVIDVKRIDEMVDYSFAADGALTLGAAVPCYRLYADERIIQNFSALTDAAKIIGGWQIQGRASVGGNLCNSSPAADTIPALFVESATCIIAGSRGRREVPVTEFCTAPGHNVLASDELLVALRLPAPAESSASRYVRFIPRNEMDIAVCGAGARVELDGDRVRSARIALGAVAPTPLLAEEAADSLRGQPADEDRFRRAGELARKIARPISDLRGPAEYRVHLVGVLVHRALSAAAQRARGGDRHPVLPLGTDPRNISETPRSPRSS